MSDQNGTSTSFGNTQGVDYYISSTPSRGKANATISSTNGMFDKTCIQKNLCQECLDKVTDTLEGYFEKGKEEYVLLTPKDMLRFDEPSINRTDFLKNMDLIEMKYIIFKISCFQPFLY